MNSKTALAAALVTLSAISLISCGDDPAPPKEKTPDPTTAEPEAPEPEVVPEAPQKPKPGEIQADHIVTRHVMLVHDASPLGELFPGRTKDVALELARKIKRRAEDGEDMKALVAEYSNDPDRGSNQGMRRVRNFGVEPLPDVREFDRASTPEMSDLAFTLEVGEVGITADAIGIFVIKREE